MSFETIRNHQESVVYELINAIAPRYPSLSRDPDLLADVACVALNSLAPRYVRHEVDLFFFMTNGERASNQAAVEKAVEAAFQRVERTERAAEGHAGAS